MSKKILFTEDEIKKLQKFASESISQSEIARKMGMHRELFRKRLIANSIEIEVKLKVKVKK